MIAYAFSVLLLAAAQAPADEPTRRDLQCFLALSALASSEKSEEKIAGLIGAQYYLGRLDGRHPALDLKAALRAEAEAMTDARIGQLLPICGVILKQRGEAVTAAGKQLEAEGF